MSQTGTILAAIDAMQILGKFSESDGQKISDTVHLRVSMYDVRKILRDVTLC